MNLKELAIDTLTSGHDKNGVWHTTARLNAEHQIMRMPADDLFELISDMVELRLEAFAKELEAKK